MYQIGQQILNGQVTILTVDTKNLILSVEVPADKSQGGDPLTITYSAGVTEAFVSNLLASL